MRRVQLILHTRVIHTLIKRAHISATPEKSLLGQLQFG